MMKNIVIRFGWFILVLISTFFACKKDNNGLNITQNCLITSIEVEYDIDETALLRFEHNSKGKVKKMIWDHGNTHFALLFYGENGKIEKIERYHLGALNGVLLYNWEGEYKVTRNWNGDAAKKRMLLFNNNGQLERIEYYMNTNFTSGWVLTSYDLYLFQNGHLSKVEYYQNDDWKKNPEYNSSEKQKYYGLISLDLDNTKINTKGTKDSFTKYKTESFYLDGKINPFYHQQTYAFFHFWGDGTSLWPMFSSKNNIVKIETLYHVYNVEEVETYNYQYNDLNYPTQKVVIGLDPPEIWQYSYNCSK